MFPSSLREDPKKEKLIDELNYKNCMCLKIKTTSKLFVGITNNKIKFIIHPEYFDANNIFSKSFFGISNIKKGVQDLSKQINKALKYIDLIKVSNSKYTKYNASLSGMVKQNNVDGHMGKTKLYYNQVGLAMLLSSAKHSSTS